MANNIKTRIQKFFGIKPKEKRIDYLGDIPAPQVTACDFLDDLFKDYKGYTPTFKIDLTDTLKKISDNAYFIITPIKAARKAQEDIYTSHDSDNPQILFFSDYKNKPVLDIFKNFLHSWTNDPEILSSFNQHINKNSIFDLLNIEAGSSFGQIDLDLFKGSGSKSTDIIQYKNNQRNEYKIGMIVHDDKDLFYKKTLTNEFDQSAFWSTQNPNLLFMHHVFVLAHEAKHKARIFRSFYDGEDRIRWHHTPDETEQTKRDITRQAETQCDLAGSESIRQFFGSSQSLDYTKKITLYRLMEGLRSGDHDHFTAPALSAWIAKQDPSFSWCAKELSQLSDQDIADGVTEGKKLIETNTLEAYQNAAQAAQTKGAKIMLSTTLKLQKMLNKNQL